MRGLRGVPDKCGKINSSPVRHLWSTARELGIPVNCMVLDELGSVSEIIAVARDHLPGLRIVIDHCLMLSVGPARSNNTEATLLAMERLAQASPTIYAKLTCGTHGSKRVFPHKDMHGPLRRIIAAFGADRCVWGSNFPNALWSKGSSYDQNLRLFTDHLGLEATEMTAILSTTALSLWFATCKCTCTHQSQQRDDGERGEAARGGRSHRVALARL